MSNSTKWINRQVRLGWLLLAAGSIVGLFGIALPGVAGDLPFNEKIITGVGILLIGVGISYLVRYAAARREPQVARRMASDELDERIQLLRGRAGNRAYWVSAGLAYAGLMWLSFAENGGLPMPTLDGIWYFLVALIVVPFIVYAASLVYDQQNH
jgi:ABC-type uncharacterized transport system permease subunit